jgi:hypothetical protein
MSADDRLRQKALTATRALARTTGLAAAGFLVFMFFGEALAPNRGPSGSIPMDMVGRLGLALNFLYVVAMVIAIRRERAGLLLGAGAETLFFVLMFLGLFHGNAAGGFRTRGILNPFLLALWVPVLLYGACWILESRGGNASSGLH